MNRTTTARPGRRYLTGWRAGFVLGGVVVLALVSLRGLVFDSTPPPRGDLVILSGADDSVGGQRQKLVDEWNRTHPDMIARIESLSSNADAQHSEMVARAQSGDSGVDVYNLDVTWMLEFATADYIRPLDGAVDTSGFLAAPLATCEFGGELWGLPFNTDAGLLYYRTDVVGADKAGLPQRLPPSDNDMQAMLRQKSDLKAGYVGQLGQYEGLTVNALEAIWAADGEVVDDDNRVVIDSPQALAGLKELAQALAPAGSQRPAMLPESRTFTERESRQAFERGEVALMRNWPVAYGQLHSGQPSIKFDVQPLPGGPSVLGGQNLAIASDSENPQGAQELISFLTSTESERRLFADGGLPATRTDAYHDARTIKAQPYAPRLLDAVNSARPRPVTAHYALFSKVFQEVVVHALAHEGALPDRAGARLTDALDGRLS